MWCIFLLILNKKKTRWGLISFIRNWLDHELIVKRALPEWSQTRNWVCISLWRTILLFKHPTPIYVFLSRTWRLKVKFTLELLSVSKWPRFFLKSLFAIIAVTFGLRDEEDVYAENTRLLKCWADGDKHKLSDRISVSKTDRWNVKS